MKRLFALLLLCLFVAPAALAADKIVKETLVSQGRKRTYYLFVPSTLEAGKPAPLLIALHGSGRNGLSQVEQWKDLATKQGLIVVGPDAKVAQTWNIPDDGPEFLRELVEALKTRFSINPRRVYLFGHSAGAEFALQMGLLESEYFAAVAVHAGALQPELYSFLDYVQRKIAFAIYIGTKDQYYSLQMVRDTKEVFDDHELPVEVVELKGHDHNYYAIAAKLNEQVWTFLRPHELPAEPKFQQYNFKQ